jgi:hypothetical protein
VSYRRTGLASLGSLLLPEDQEKRIDAMRKDTLDRIDRTAATIKGGLTASSVVTAVATGMLLLQARNLSRSR